VRVEVYDLRGRSVRVLHDGALAAGRQELVWDGKDDAGSEVASGMYLARARGEQGEARPHRMMLVK
jgi:flagellar hook assembly protein FlgD